MPDKARRVAERGPGMRAHVPTSPAVLAERLERAAVGSKRARGERVRAHTALLEGLAGMPMDELRKHVGTRQWMIALYHLGGYDAETIAKAIGYRRGEPVRAALRHPVVVRLVEQRSA